MKLKVLLSGPEAEGSLPDILIFRSHRSELRSAS